MVKICRSKWRGFKTFKHKLRMEYCYQKTLKSFCQRKREINISKISLTFVLKTPSIYRNSLSFRLTQRNNACFWITILCQAKECRRKWTIFSSPTINNNNEATSNSTAVVSTKKLLQKKDGVACTISFTSLSTKIRRRKCLILCGSKKTSRRLHKRSIFTWRIISYWQTKKSGIRKISERGR